jgi:hypothetical protein
MSWDKKARGHEKGYFYRCKRVAGRPVKTCLGRGRAGEMAALLDEHAREQRQAARLKTLQERADLALADLALKESRELTNLLTEATLLLAGYHLHHGCWRRRRGSHAASEG